LPTKGVILVAIVQ